ncbi:hypothetical protein MKS88_001839 [Plasmodium brasilianum]|uniref:Thioredoxin-like protein n=2 Tax=Plasmodium (Plasmodium) TaxID=418103 RepID=A0A1A8VW43_PLAMA|nr:conserved Plasmodium protein, unknown function [Plasmodium malariae]KAI4839292.1 hypothetical protein MKS88_001839 [Plasmodium brasilianum]SBS83568.1 hypothetical protein PMALA_007180 [Plasmodium malariae]SBT87704.1 conserved Plasmodium protein, unknown function [Plasmodium malariae]
MFKMIKTLKLSRLLKFNSSRTKYLNVVFSKHFNTVKNDCMKIDNTYIYNVYKLNDIYYHNLKVINNYDEYFNLVIKNEYFTDYSKIQNKLKESRTTSNDQNVLGELCHKQAVEEQKNNLGTISEGETNENNSKNIITSNDLQVLYFGSYENNISIIFFEKFKSIIEKNKKLQFFFLDVNVCPQCSYNCDITYVPCICLIYKNHIFRKKIEINYESPIDENYLNEFLSNIQQSIDTFHSYNNKFIYTLKKQSNYLNTKYIDIDNQNIHKENWNTY